MVLVVLEGAAGVGKTTLARILAREYGLRYVAVEAERCWPLPPGAERQACFLAAFDRIIRNAYADCSGDVCVLDNGYYTVAAYTLAMIKTVELGTAELNTMVDIGLQALHYAYMFRSGLGTVLLVDVPDQEIRARILRRLPQRSRNKVEAIIELHLGAQAELRAIARRSTIPVVENTRSPEEVAKELYERLTRVFREAQREWKPPREG